MWGQDGLLAAVNDAASVLSRSHDHLLNHIKYSSGTTIYGHQTKFADELSVGDAIIITHPTSLVEETKIVKMVLSNVSISISSGFSTDLVSTTQFRFVKAPKPKGDAQADADAAKKAKVIPKDSEEVTLPRLYALCQLLLMICIFTGCFRHICW